MPGIGPLEIAIVLIIVLLIFGPKRLPGLGRSLGTGMREFKDSITGGDKEDREDEDESDRRPELSKASANGEPDHAAPAAARREPSSAASRAQPADDAS